MSDEWIEWTGGDNCPVDRRTLTEIRFRNGTVLKTDLPEQWRWTDSQPGRGCDYDIVAYRPSPPSA